MISISLNQSLMHISLTKIRVRRKIQQGKRPRSFHQGTGLKFYIYTNFQAIFFISHRNDANRRVDHQVKHRTEKYSRHTELQNCTLLRLLIYALAKISLDEPTLISPLPTLHRLKILLLHDS